MDIVALVIGKINSSTILILPRTGEFTTYFVVTMFGLMSVTLETGYLHNLHFI